MRGLRRTLRSCVSLHTLMTITKRRCRNSVSVRNCDLYLFHALRRDLLQFFHGRLGRNRRRRRFYLVRGWLREVVGTMRDDLDRRVGHDYHELIVGEPIEGLALLTLLLLPPHFDDADLG